MRFLKFGLLIGVIFSLLISCEMKNEQEDPFIWLEEIDGEEQLAWAKAHNDATVAILEKEPGFQAIYDKNIEIYDSKERIAYPSIRGKYVYNVWKDDKNPRGLWRRTTLKKYLKGNPKWETVLDIDALSEKEEQKWVLKGVRYLEPEYRYCIVRLSPGGGDAVEMREFDLKTKTFVKDGFFLPTAKGSISWKDYDHLYVQTDFGPGSMTTSGYPRITKIWQRGTELSNAETIFEGDSTDVSVSAYVIRSTERNYEIVHRGITFYTSHQYVIEDGKLYKLDVQDDVGFNGFFKGQMLLQLKTAWSVKGNTYPQGALISIDYNKFKSGNRDFTEIVVPDERSSIASVSWTKNILLVNMTTNVTSELYKYKFNSGKWLKGKVPAPEYGNIRVVNADDYSDNYFFTYTSFLSPSTLYYSSKENKKIKPVKQLPAFFDASGMTVEQFEAKSKDGTMIPYFVVHHKNMELNGKNPTLLYGYGGFEISMKPYYSATVGSAWLEKGGVYVLSNIRGGGEFGPKWHHAALKENRQRAFDDFSAIAEDLTARKITSPEHLGISGGSNGGLLVGVAYTQRPDLYNAVVCRVPLLDMKRYNKLLAGASWMGEYGNPDIPEEWVYISKYSPYQNVSKDASYPVVFFNTSTRDDRVHPGHARKMVAKMESLGHKVYYYENIEGGHGASSTNKQAAYQNALIYSYLLKQLK